MHIILALCFPLVIYIFVKYIQFCSNHIEDFAIDLAFTLGIPAMIAILIIFYL